VPRTLKLPQLAQLVCDKYHNNGRIFDGEKRTPLRESGVGRID